jgi:peptide/nickel transport system permease protein
MVLLAVLVTTALVVVITYPADFGSARWGNPSVWADNPKSAAPAWTNLLTRADRVRHEVHTLDEPTDVERTERATTLVYDVPVDFSADEPPTALTLSVDTVRFERRPPVLTATLVRPDGAEVTLMREVIRGPRRGEDGPYVRHDEEPLRVVLGGDPRSTDELVAHFDSQYGSQISIDIVEDHPLAALFGAPSDEAAFTPLRGDYRLELHVMTASEGDDVASVTAVVGGSVYGAMGTDALGRDLAEGLLYGLPVALLIGILTATVSTLIGMTLGMVSGYFGGATDMVVQRAADIVANVPLLPLLIFLVFIVGSHLWLILAILVAFSWPGLTIMVRSMVLQLRTGQEVEAARALGASPWRVIFRHILPHAASYLLAQLVFFAPSAILAEAGLSFLGLGDPSIPTWGQILEYGFRTGAVFLGYWWWVIPPGLLIVITAVTFMFLALGLEPVVDPRLRGRRAWRS